MADWPEPGPGFVRPAHRADGEGPIARRSAGAERARFWRENNVSTREIMADLAAERANPEVFGVIDCTEHSAAPAAWPPRPDEAPEGVVIR